MDLDVFNLNMARHQAEMEIDRKGLTRLEDLPQGWVAWGYSWFGEDGSTNSPKKVEFAYLYICLNYSTFRNYPARVRTHWTTRGITRICWTRRAFSQKWPAKWTASLCDSWILLYAFFFIFLYNLYLLPHQWVMELKQIGTHMLCHYSGQRWWNSMEVKNSNFRAPKMIVWISIVEREDLDDLYFSGNRRRREGSSDGDAAGGSLFGDRHVTQQTRNKSQTRCQRRKHSEAARIAEWGWE